MSTIARRKEIGFDTISRTFDVINSTPSASNESTFLRAADLPSLDTVPSPDHPSAKIRVVNSDAFAIARDIARRDPGAKGRITVLNLASDELPGGGWSEHSWYSTQEEALCYASTLFATLKHRYYPWPNMGKGSVAGIYSPGVVIFKDDLSNDCADLPHHDRLTVSVITVAAPRGPTLSEDRENFAHEVDLRCLEDKIRFVYRLAAVKKQEYLVLGAMGCGAYRCPPRLVAMAMKRMIMEPEFAGRWKEVIFAVFGKKDAVRDVNNFDIFQGILDGIETA